MHFKVKLYIKLKCSMHKHKIECSVRNVNSMMRNESKKSCYDVWNTAVTVVVIIVIAAYHGNLMLNYNNFFNNFFLETAALQRTLTSNHFWLILFDLIIMKTNDHSCLHLMKWKSTTSPFKISKKRSQTLKLSLKPTRTNLKISLL